MGLPGTFGVAVVEADGVDFDEDVLFLEVWYRPRREPHVVDAILVRLPLAHLRHDESGFGKGRRGLREEQIR